MDFRLPSLFGRRDVAAGEDPFTAIRREMDRLFDEMTKSFGLPRTITGEPVLAPRVDVKETEDAIVVQAELPGVEEKDVEIEYADGVLTIRGEKKLEREEEEKDKGYYLMERRYGAFLRRLAMPVEVDENRIEASFDKGVLTITLPKKPETQPKRIQIRTGS
ncbi:Spore protein SP21 [bacterium HR40]|nr:Spore protein SP21 [bacterium HR40]